MTKLTRRTVLSAGVALAVTLMLRVAPARAADADAFITAFADQLLRVVNSDQSAATQKAAFGPIIDSHVDVAGVARFCLGRFWATASADQQQRYVALFHQVLMTSITGHLGSYKGVSYRITGTENRGDDTYVMTPITRPNQPVANVQWVVSAAPMVVDVLTEGISLRQAQRDDYASFLGQHGGNVDALIAAMQRQVSGAG